MLGYINRGKACEMHKNSFLLTLDWCGLSWGSLAHYRHRMAPKEWISRKENLTYKEPVKETELFSL